MSPTGWYATIIKKTGGLWLDISCVLKCLSINRDLKFNFSKTIISLPSQII